MKLPLIKLLLDQITPIACLSSYFWI